MILWRVSVLASAGLSESPRGGGGVLVGGGGGGGYSGISHIRRLGLFFWVQNSELQYFF